VRKVVFAFGALLLGVLFYWWQPVPQPMKRVVFVSASGTAFHEAIRDAFLKVVRSSAVGKRIEVKVISIPKVEDATILTAVCQDVLMIPADCILCVGRAISSTLVNLARKRECKTPIVFVAVQNPLELGIVDSLERPGGTATGVIPFPQEDSITARLLYAAFPNTKSVLIPFYFPLDTVGEVERRARRVKEYLGSCGIKATILPIDSLSDVMSRIEAALASHDLLMTLEGEVLNETQYIGFAKLAERYNLGYFAGIMAAASENVLAVYATEARYTAEAGLAQIVKILFYHTAPGLIPVTVLSSTRELLINQQRAKELGLSVDLNEVNARIDADLFCSTVRGRVRLI